MQDQISFNPLTRQMDGLVVPAQTSGADSAGKFHQTFQKLLGEQFQGSIQDSKGSSPKVSSARLRDHQKDLIPTKNGNSHINRKTGSAAQFSVSPVRSKFRPAHDSQTNVQADRQSAAADSSAKNLRARGNSKEETASQKPYADLSSVRETPVARAPLSKPLKEEARPANEADPSAEANSSASAGASLTESHANETSSESSSAPATAIADNETNPLTGATFIPDESTDISDSGQIPPAILEKAQNLLQEQGIDLSSSMSKEQLARAMEILSRDADISKWLSDTTSSEGESRQLSLLTTLSSGTGSAGPLQKRSAEAQKQVSPQESKLESSESEIQEETLLTTSTDIEGEPRPASTVVKARISIDENVQQTSQSEHSESETPASEKLSSVPTLTERQSTVPSPELMTSNQAATRTEDANSKEAAAPTDGETAEGQTQSVVRENPELRETYPGKDSRPTKSEGKMREFLGGVIQHQNTQDQNTQSSQSAPTAAPAPASDLEMLARQTAVLNAQDPAGKAAGMKSPDTEGLKSKAVSSYQIHEATREVPQQKGSAGNQGGQGFDQSFGQQMKAGQTPEPSAVRYADPTRATIFAQLVERAQMLSGPDQLKTLTVHLKPEYLGKVALELTSKDGSLTARIVAESKEVRDHLEALAPSIKAHLEQQGISVESISIELSRKQAGEQGQAFNQAEQGGNGSARSRSGKSKISTVGSAGEDTAAVPEIQTETSGIDIRA